jgi:replicative DNA helicase
MPSLSSKKNERRILALLMQEPTHMRATKLDLDLFIHKDHREAAALIKKYVTRYKNAPSVSTLKRFADTQARSISDAESVVSALLVIEGLPKVAQRDADFEFDQAENYKLGRDLASIAELVKDRFDAGDVNYRDLHKEILTDLLTTAGTDSNRIRGTIFSTVKARASDYTKAENNEVTESIPFGIKALDSKIKGLIKPSVNLMYSKTGGGKTRTAVNIAYNAAKSGYNVMYFTLEMAFNLLATCFDSRMAWVNTNDILFGNLSQEDKKKYAKALKKQLKEKLNVWIVDVSMGARSSMIFEEIEIYRAINGVNPDLVVIDYANLMSPEAPFRGRSEKYDFLFQEYHEIAKYFKIAILTATQESRDAAKTDIEARKKKQEVEQGVHNIGLSHYMAPHCETVIRLKQDSKDVLQNRLWAIIDKNRYGSLGAEIPLMALWDKSYVGDRVLNDTKVYKLKPSAMYQEEL